MLELGECNQLLVTESFTEDDFTVSNSNHDTPTFNSSDYHPLHTRSASPERRSAGMQSDAIVGGESGTRPGLTRLLNLNEASVEEVSEEVVGEAPEGVGDILIHSVCPNDSFASVALRYDISIAALRRANQLWPSDPIHLRTELFIPRGGILPPRHKSLHHASAGASLIPTVELTPGLSPDLVVSSFVAARNMILSVLPARLSLESLSSRASASEDHELGDLRTLPASFAQEGHELSTLTIPYAQYKSPVIRSSNIPYHIPRVNDLHSHSVSLPHAISLERPPMQPFAVRPVRTSQLEPEPAMELPVRRSAFNNRPAETIGTRRRQPLHRPRNLGYG